MTEPQTLQQWRTTWTEDDINWRTGWMADVDERRQERELEQKARRRRDRKSFGQETWGASARVANATTNAEKLKKFDLPTFFTESDLAGWLDISLTRLRWFTFERPVDLTWHYIRYQVPKRRGGHRVILAPKSDLKAFQRKILHDLLEKVPAHPAAHGFVGGHSIITNAQPHVGKAFVLNLDLKDFFPTIKYRRVRGLFAGLGYSFSLASTLALLCTEHDRLPFQRGGKTYYASISDRQLVQGAPTSPMIANLVARRLDARLTGLAQKHNITYTRYADDLTFSGDDYNAIMRVYDAAHYIIHDEGFAVHPEKTKLYRQSSRQIVTGVVVNEKTTVPRDVRRKVRAILHNAQKTGLAAQNHDHVPDFRAYLQGLIGYIYEANEAHGKQLLSMLKAVKD